MTARWLLGSVVFCWMLAGPATAQEADDSREPMLLETGGAAEWGISDGESAYGGTVSLQVTPFNDWLEFETGVTPLFRRGHSEWQTDLVAQVPIDLDPALEINLGAGPEWTHTTSRRGTKDSAGVEAQLDLVYWPTPEHRIGLFLEPAYEYDFREHDQSFALSFGLAVPV